MDPLALAAALVVMAAVVAALTAVYQATASPRSAVQHRLGGILRGPDEFQPSLAQHEALRPDKVGRTPIIGFLLQGRSWTAEMADQLERADIRLTVSEFLALRILAALILAVLLTVFLGGGLVGLVVAIVAGVAGFLIPSLYVSMAQTRRVSKLEQQLVEALSLIANSLKAGFGLLQSVELASRQLEHPIATELRHLVYDTNVGSSLETALMAMASRAGSRDLDIVVTGMLVQQSAGGNLSEILDNVAHTMRERIRIRGEIKTLTSQQMLTGLVIGGLPVFLAVGFSIMSPDYMKPLVTTTLGNAMLIGAGMMEFFGFILIRRILAIEV